VFAFAVLFFLVMHSFESSVFALEMVYEHRNYLPSVGLWMLAAWVLYQVCDRHAPHFQLPLVVVLMLAMTFATGWRASAWRDEAVLARVNLLAHPDSVRSRYHYANTTLRLAEAHRGGAAAAPLLQEARQGYRALADMSPAGFTAPVSLIYIASVHDRDFPAAAREFEALWAAVGQRVPQPEDLNALSLLIDCETAALCRLGSAPVLELLDRVQAVSAQAYYLETLRGRLLAAYPGEASRAIAAFEAALREYPGYVPADIGLARLLSGEGRDGEAVEVLRRLSAADPRRIQLPVLRASLDFGARD
jgi:tetratricopeptide (TPR) repeat protein